MNKPHGGWGLSRHKAITTCHPERKHYAKGLCRYCYANSPHMQGKRQEYYQANRAQWIKHAKGSQERKRAKIYGIPVSDIQRMIAEQNGLCYLCGRPPRRKSLAVDHCHRTGRIRKMLCHPCNLGLGLWKDDMALFQRAIDYLREHS